MIFLEIIYFIQQKKNIGSFDSDFPISESEQETIDLISKNINMSTLIVFWQFVLKVLEEVTIVSNPYLSLEMLVTRLVHLKEMPSYENVLDSINQNNFKEEENNNKTIDINYKKKVYK